MSTGSVKLVKEQEEENWKDEGFVESMLPEEQEAGWELVLPDNGYNLSGSIQAIQESDNSTEEKKRKFIHEKFQIDENKIWNQDEKQKRKWSKYSGKAFWFWRYIPNIKGKQIS